ncbi:unnamed protein product [Sphagnum balticum]
MKTLFLAAFCFASAALASESAAPKMAMFAKRYTVKGCDFQENYRSYPKDYWCRVKEIAVVDRHDNSYEIIVYDENNKKVPDVLMNEFKNENKNGQQETAGFDSDGDDNAKWSHAIDATGTHFTDNRAFSKSSDGTVSYQRQIMYYDNNTYKNADWSYTLIKK